MCAQFIKNFKLEIRAREDRQRLRSGAPALRHHTRMERDIWNGGIAHMPHKHLLARGAHCARVGDFECDARAMPKGLERVPHIIRTLLQLCAVDQAS